jgi:alkanesulfonate monooxygenase SsuD/methylene tetrahydromethanopterin reductase-like flavin-dependent oxidoreductase (luciferase family)
MLEFGFFDTFGRAEKSDLAGAYDAHIAAVQLAEQLGYGYYFFIEHQNAKYPVISSPSVYLAAVARATSTIRIGAMVFAVPFHHPVRLAQDAAMVDQLSRGRLEFAVGYGTRAPEFEPWHLDFGQRREIGVEVMEVVLKAWASDTLDHEGAYFQFTGASPQPRPYQQPHPPVWMGAHSETSMDYAADMNFNVAQNLDTEPVATQKFEYWRRAWHARGHSGVMPRTLFVRHVHVAETDEQARAEAEPFLREGILGQAGVARAASLRPDEKNPAMLEIARIALETTRSYDFWIDEGLAFVGSPKTVERLLREQQVRMGYDIFCAHHQITSMPSELALSSLRLFGESVIPALRGAVPVG